MHTLTAAASFGGQTFAAGSYVVPMKQARRGMAHTALSVGTDISSRISRVYAPPTAWSLGYLWGADTVTIPAGATFAPADGEDRARPCRSAAAWPGRGDMIVLEVDSPSAIRTLNGALAAGLRGHRLTAPAGEFAAGSVAFAADPATTATLSGLAAANEVTLRRAAAASLPTVEPVAGVPRIAVLATSLNQEVWALRRARLRRRSGLDGGAESARPIRWRATTRCSTRARGRRRPTPSARARLSAFFARGGGYVGGGTNAGAFLVSAGEVAGLATANRSGNGRSGIINWVRESAASPDHRRLPGARHGDRRPAGVVHVDAVDDDRRRAAAADGLPGRGPVAGRRAVDHARRARP